ncbi:zinc-binding alcohol dehydrogenase family protein [Isoalcanivorax beigongshangi]|uniref:Zinc-type alcohol dehydrogenase-like protein n=1 Tax=Isoalcanivorax beigongshangi TaxID=3238810 RepID=A0ABV4AFW9_9GAMM
MKAVAITANHPIDHPDALLDLELPAPLPTATDLLVQVAAVSVNPVDTKVRRNLPIPTSGQRVLGWDAVGTVVACGAQVSSFQPGDRVWYAGELKRQGSNAELQCVDYRLAAKAPASWSDADAAAVPLTALTAWELAFDRLAIQPDEQGSAVVIIGAAGGVGSMLVQLLRARTGLTVIGTASRPQSQQWLQALGAHHVVDHHGDWVAQVRALGIASVPRVISLNHTDQHLDAIVEILAPFGQLALIDDPQQFQIGKLKRKSLSLHWEYMFTRALFGTADLAAQGQTLAEVARLAEAGQLRSTRTHHGGRINAASLRAIHADLEAGKHHGKCVLEGF